MACLAEKRNVYRQMPIFGGLNDAALDLIITRSTTLDKLPGEYFFHQNDEATSFFVLLEGSVAVEKSLPGDLVEVCELGHGDCFGEMSIVDLEPRSAAVKAVTHCQALEITRMDLMQLFQTEMEQYAIIMMNMGREISRRLRSSRG